MSPVIARSLRRASPAAGALAATLMGHALTVGETRILPVAPLLWLTAIALVFLVVLCAGQGFLVRAMKVVRAVARALRHPARRRSPARPAGERLDVLLPSSSWRHRPRSSRGPPEPALARAGSGRMPAPS